MPKPLEKSVNEIQSGKISFCDYVYDYVCTKCTKTVEGNFDLKNLSKDLKNIHFLDIWKRVRK